MGLLSGMLGNAEVVVPEELVADDGKLLAEEKMIEAGFKIP